MKSFSFVVTFLTLMVCTEARLPRKQPRRLRAELTADEIAALKEWLEAEQRGSKTGNEESVDTPVVSENGPEVINGGETEGRNAEGFFDKLFHGPAYKFDPNYHY